MRNIHASRFCIKTGYHHRAVSSRSHAPRDAAADLLLQPDAYDLTEVLADRFGATTIIEIGYQSRRLLAKPRRFDHSPDLEGHHRERSRRHGIDTSLQAGRPLGISNRTLSQSVVVCAGVIERLPDPTRLLTLLSQWSRVAHAVIVTTPERDVLRGRDDMGPPSDANRAREWNLVEFQQLLKVSRCDPTVIGLTVGDNRCPDKNTIIAVLDRFRSGRRRRVPDDFRPLAVVATYNDADIAPQVVARLLDDSIDVHILDNWSTDGTFEAMRDLSVGRRNLTVERFPEGGATPYFEWSPILRRKEHIAAQHPGRWIIHHDSDEIRCSPWQDVSLRAGLHTADRMGFNAIDFTVGEFRPVGKPFSHGMNPETQIPHFEFGARRDHFLQLKAWRQPATPINLTGSGGHDVQFAGRRTFPYKFFTKHYSLRSQEQARRKIFMERKERFCPTERAKGWHTHYNGWRPEHQFVWTASELIEFDEQDTRQRFMTELIAGIGIIR